MDAPAPQRVNANEPLFSNGRMPATQRFGERMHALFDERRYLLDLSPHAAPLPRVVTDTLVIGGGAAGLRAAIAAAEYGKVILIAKAAPEWTNTSWAQGGVAAAMGEGDTFERHVADTLAAGAGLCDEHVVRAVVEAAPQRLEELIEWGMRFDRDIAGALSLGLEGAHSAARILHAGGDATGRELTRCLLAQARQLDRIVIIDNCFAVDLVSAEGAGNGDCPPPVLGAITCDDWFGLRFLQARATVLASGGAGMVYRETSNPRFATGDGLAMAYRAGAAVADMAFVQFHPTTLHLPGAPRRLISEAVRGEGAHLVDENGARFMVDEHPLAELAPRDVVSRAIARLQRRGGRAFLDVRHLRAFTERFPGIRAMLLGHGLDPARDLIPVGPAAHFMIGGVVTDLEGRTNVPGLFAAGEVASVGLHGANRLASNSLLEGLVLGEAAGRAAARWGHENGFGQETGSGLTGGRGGRRRRAARNEILGLLQTLMWEHAGIERSETGLSQARDRLHALAGNVMDRAFSTPGGWEVQNLLLTVALIVESALWRRESRGCHWREDAAAPSVRFAVHDEWRRGAPLHVRQVFERYPEQTGKNRSKG